VRQWGIPIAQLLNMIVDNSHSSSPSCLLLFFLNLELFNQIEKEFMLTGGCFGSAFAGKVYDFACTIYLYIFPRLGSKLRALWV
jgi:hypothetical protein